MELQHRRIVGEPRVLERVRGAPGFVDARFIVLVREVDVLSGATLVHTLRPGEHFGEMALIRSQPRSASVVSRGPSELLLIRRSEFFEIMRSQPRIGVKLLWEFTGVLADRLAETTRSLGSARVELADGRATLVEPATTLVYLALTAGSGHVRYLNAGHLPSGLYFVRVAGETFRATRTALLVK